MHFGIESACCAFSFLSLPSYSWHFLSLPSSLSPFTFIREKIAHRVSDWQSSSWKKRNCACETISKEVERKKRHWVETEAFPLVYNRHRHPLPSSPSLVCHVHAFSAPATSHLKKRSQRLKQEVSKLLILFYAVDHNTLTACLAPDFRPHVLWFLLWSAFTCRPVLQTHFTFYICIRVKNKCCCLCYRVL